MGKNKDRLLTKSIPWADSILEQVMNLPAAGGEDLQSTAEAQALAVENLLKMVNRKVGENRGEGEYVWKKLAAEGGEFVDFVVSSDVDAYPDGGTQDGYWYELFDPATLIAENIREGVDIWGVIGAMSEGLSTEDFGFSKLAIDEFSFSSNTMAYNRQINHSLGAVPAGAIIVALGTVPSTSSNGNIINAAMVFLNAKSIAVGYTHHLNNSIKISAWNDDSSTITSTYIKTTIGSKYFPAGIAYKLITFA